MLITPDLNILINSDSLEKVCLNIDIGADLSYAQRYNSAFCYAFTRLLELQSAWLPLVKDSEFKVFLGHRIGYDASNLRLISDRLGSLLTPPPLFSALSGVCR